MQCSTQKLETLDARDRHRAARTAVLLVDDNPTNIRVLRAMLGAEDYDIVAVDSGQAALDLVRANPQFDLILLDVAMPDLNGIEVCRRLKEDLHTQHIPVVLISGLRVSDESVGEGLRAGADGYLLKPVEETALRAWVRATLRIRRFEREAADGSPRSGATASDDMLQEFARLSRRVNDPLQTLCAAADLLAAELPRDAQNQVWVDQIFAQIDRVARLVADASRLARERLSQ